MVACLALICTLAVALCYPRASVAKNCCVPKQWEGFQGGIGGVDVNGGQAVQIVNRIAFDAINRRLYFYTNSSTASGVSSIKLIQDYSKNAIYVIDVLKRTCQKTTPSQPFNDGCVPDAAKQVFDMTLGLGTEALQTKVYTMRQQQLNISFSVTENTCVPVGEYWIGSINNMKTVMSMQYFDITQGIKDPSVFTPPSICKQNTSSIDVFHPVLSYGILGL